MSHIRILFFLLIVSLFGCNGTDDDSSSGDDPLIFDCDMESAVTDGDQRFFETTNPDYSLGGAFAQDSTYARSGTYGIRLDSTNLYGLNGEIKNVKEGEFVQVSVWQRKADIDGTLEVHLKSEDEKFVYRTYKDIHDPGEDGWIRHYLSFRIGKGVKSINFHVFSGSRTTYFDDLSFRKYRTMPQNDLPVTLRINIPDSSQQKLNKYIKKATQFEAIPSSSKKYVPAEIVIGEDTAGVEMKLKGDWNDHLYSGKESYRIKIKGDLAFQGLKSFSIQHPKTRRYLDEWIVHRMFEREDMLTTTYGFINVEVNGINYGVYGLEEHFDKQLLESRKRREGPILKFDETSYWTTIKQFDSFDSMVVLPYFEESMVSVFKKNRTRKSEQLSKQFNEGKTLLWLFKNKHLAVEDIFDMDELARFHVLMELSGSGHGLRWHNRRFYFNPVTQKLENVAYDILPFMRGRKFECQIAQKLLYFQRKSEYSFDNTILFNETFKERYLFYLEQKTHPAYLDSLFDDLEAELQVNLAAIQGEVSTYKFDKELYYENAEFLRSWLPKLDTLWSSKTTTYANQDWEKPTNFKPRHDQLFLKDLSVNAYLDTMEGYYEVYAENYHLNTITLRGYKIKGEDGPVLFDQGIALDGYQKRTDHAIFKTMQKPSKVYFTVENNPDLVLSKKIIPWKKPGGISTRVELTKAFDPKATYYNVSGNQIVFNRSVEIDRLLSFPDKYEVIINPGVTLEFKNGGGIIVSNSFTAVGTESSPIRIFCTDSSSNGITVLNGEQAELSHVSLEGLSNLNYKNWELTGALTIYETRVKMYNCSIDGNHSEDALNIIRSDFAILNLSISNTFSDGFDADFCTGRLKASTFEATGNDCIDFSGSEVTISDIEIKNSGDKGISGGEGSTLELQNIGIDGAITGVAAKDASVIKGSEVFIYNAEYGCAAFRKKPEYEGAFIELFKSEVNETQREVLVELGSVVALNGVRHKGHEKLDVEALYARFE